MVLHLGHQLFFLTCYFYIKQAHRVESRFARFKDIMAKLNETLPLLWNLQAVIINFSQLEHLLFSYRNATTETFLKNYIQNIETVLLQRCGLNALEGWQFCNPIWNEDLTQPSHNYQIDKIFLNKLLFSNSCKPF